MLNNYCGHQEEPAILISRLLLCVRGTYVATASFRLPLRMSGMHRTKKRNVATHVWTFYHSESSITRNLSL